MHHLLIYNQMVVDSVTERQADRIFHALADSTRRDILRRAMGGDRSVSALARLYPMSFAAVQKHVAVLEEAGLVTKHRQGRERLVETDIEAIETANRLLDQFEEMWRGRISRLDEMLAGPE
jgi:DNA-binding transcriptional ArsR family regulator